MRLTTWSGSTYEVDIDNKKIRRLAGKEDPTPRQGRDGDWRSYNRIVPDMPEIGKNVVICWGDDVKPVIEGDIPATVTSLVAAVVPDEAIN